MSAAPGRAGLPVALSFGMGKDSAATLARWLTDPTSRDFPLSDLTVVTAMTGDEPDITRRLMEDHLLPLMCRSAIRFVQIARAEQRGSRYVVLDDSRRPRRMVMRGPWRLSDELRASGTGFTIGIGRGGSVLAPMLGGLLFQWGYSLPFVCLFMGTGPVIAAALLAQIPARMQALPHG